MSWCRTTVVMGLLSALIASVGCLAGRPPNPKYMKHPKITARPASPQNMGEPCGIPFYLPKPLLVVSKNFHHVNEHPYGLTHSAPIKNDFDGQDKYATLSNTSTVKHDMSRKTEHSKEVPSSSESLNELIVGASPLSPGAGRAPMDGLAPITFFTYEIVFVPDMTQKYVLDISGGAGEFRAALNMINGWQFTGLGPFYMKDSSTAQNLLAKGVAINLGLQGAADVIGSSADLVGAVNAGGKEVNPADVSRMANAIKEASKQEKFDFDSIEQGTIERYAEIYVYEPSLGPDGQMAWRQIVGDFDPATQQFMGHKFERTYLGSVTTTFNPQAAEAVGKSLEPMTRALVQQDPPPSSRDSDEGTAGAARDDIRENIGLLPTQEVKPAMYQDIIDQTLLRQKPAEAEEKKKLLDVFHHNINPFQRKRGKIENRTLNLQQ